MAKTPTIISIQAKESQQMGDVTRALQSLTDRIAPEDIIKFSRAVEKNPQLVKTALKFV